MGKSKRSYSAFFRYTDVMFSIRVFACIYKSVRFSFRPLAYAGKLLDKMKARCKIEI